MNCPFCKTPIEKHKVGRCADAWLSQLMGKPPTITFYKEKSFDTYDFTANHTVFVLASWDTTKIEYSAKQYSTSLDLFTAEIIPKVNETHYFDLSQVSEDSFRMGVFIKNRPTDGYLHNDFGATLDEVFFRASIRVLKAQIGLSIL